MAKQCLLSGGTLAALYLVVALIIADLPSRWSLATHQARLGGGTWAYFAAGTAADIRHLTLPFAASCVVAVALSFAIRRRWPSVRDANKAVAIAICALFVPLMLASFGATEFRIERGMYPLMADLSQGLSSVGYVKSTIRIFILDRFLWPAALAVMLLASVTVLFLRRSKSFSKRLGWLEVASFALCLVLPVRYASRLQHAIANASQSIPTVHVTRSPLPIFFGVFLSPDNVERGFLALFQQIQLPRELRPAGASQLGFAPDLSTQVETMATASSCQPHPLRSPLLPEQSAPFAQTMQRKLHDLSEVLFAHRREPLLVWIVAMEGFRGDDVFPVNPHAPADIAPVTSALYERAATTAPTVIATTRMYQGGMRTSHALAALTCGLGTMPFNVSFARDIGLQPFRCLPDVLADAGFEMSFYYGADPTFDNMVSFARYHGFDRLITEKDFDNPYYGEVWGVPDRELLLQALDDSMARPSQSQLNLVLTLTNHHPFATPSDCPPATRQRVQTALAKRNIVTDQAMRLQTHAYSDAALGDFLAKIQASQAASRSVVVVVADHALTGYPLWKPDALTDRDWRVAQARIPFAVVLPDRLIAESSDVSQAHQLISQINELLATRPISQNDIPMMLLALLYRSAELRSLPEPWRWHNIGAQALSSHFRVRGEPEAAITSLTASGSLLLIKGDGELLPRYEEGMGVQTPEEALKVLPALHPSAAFLSSFIANYGKRCWSHQHIRATP